MALSSEILLQHPSIDHSALLIVGQLHDRIELQPCLSAGAVASFLTSLRSHYAA